MSLIQIKNLHFCYNGAVEPVFDGFHASIDTDWRLALTGRNGRGKTTLLKILAGQLPDSGAVTKSVRCRYFPVPPIRPDEIAIDYARSAAPRAEEWEFERELELMSADDDLLRRPFSALSPGERTKVMLAALFLAENGYPLIDEPTNHLDMRAREALADYLSRKRGFLLVSHDRDFLDRAVDHVLALGKTGPELIRGNFSTWWREKCARDEAERGRNEKLRREIRRLNEAARRTENWADKIERSKYGSENAGLKVDRGFVGHKSAKMMKRAKCAERRAQEKIEEKSALFRDIERCDRLEISPERFFSERLIALSDVTVRYGEKTAVSHVSFEISRGERVALLGPNGSGKTSLIKLICGMPLDYTGTLEKSHRLKISYVPQTTEYVSGSLSAFAAARGLDESLFMTLLFKFGFPRALFSSDTAALSAGQKKKIALAASLAERAHLYVWDEPLNYVDVFSRMQISGLLAECGAAVLFVEHDRAFAESIATKTVILP